MVAKLIKVDHSQFIIVNDSKIEPNDYFATYAYGILGHGKGWFISKNNEDVKSKLHIFAGGKKIIASTKLLDFVSSSISFYGERGRLDSTVIQKLIGEVNYWDKGFEVSRKSKSKNKSSIRSGYYKGYKECLNDNKHKKFTKDDMLKAILLGINASRDNKEIMRNAMFQDFTDIRTAENLLDALEDKLYVSQWDITIDDNNEIKLIENGSK